MATPPHRDDEVEAATITVGFDGREPEPERLGDCVWQAHSTEPAETPSPVPTGRSAAVAARPTAGANSVDRVHLGFGTRGHVTPAHGDGLAIWRSPPSEPSLARSALGIELPPKRAQSWWGRLRATQARDALRGRVAVGARFGDLVSLDSLSMMCCGIGRSGLPMQGRMM